LQAFPREGSTVFFSRVFPAFPCLRLSFQRFVKTFPVDFTNFTHLEITFFIRVIDTSATFQTTNELSRKQTEVSSTSRSIYEVSTVAACVSIETDVSERLERESIL
jgi:hypothetical protein